MTGASILLSMYFVRLLSGCGNVGCYALPLSLSLLIYPRVFTYIFLCCILAIAEKKDAIAGDICSISPKGLYFPFTNSSYSFFHSYTSLYHVSHVLFGVYHDWTHKRLKFFFLSKTTYKKLYFYFLYGIIYLMISLISLLDWFYTFSFQSYFFSQ